MGLADSQDHNHFNFSLLKEGMFCKLCGPNQMLLISLIFQKSIMSFANVFS